ncbi:MAG: divalent metal cation transporter [Verrucomicrobia bacterium]|nr:divalent metal cation transporter [Verrucomicrobiota bacterium]
MTTSAPTNAKPARAPDRPRQHRRPLLRALGLGLITGAADDDPSAIGTYASAGATLGPSFLWTAPVTFPMMVAVVYLSSKLGQVCGKGLFGVMRDIYPRWLLYITLVGVLIGNTIEAAADIGGMGAALQLLVPVAMPWIIAGVTLTILALQVFGSYTLIRNVFRWLALALLAYVAAAFFARPDLGPVIRGTLVPTIHFNRQFLSLLVAVIGTTLSAYLYTWQSNQEVEERIAAGQTRLKDRQGASSREMNQTLWDVIAGMFFSNVIMYFIILATAATLFKVGRSDINTAADAAQALVPLAGKAAGLLFALGVIGVGFLAVPVMTTGAAYDLAQTCGWKHGLYKKPRQAKAFYAAITGFTLVAMAMNFLGVNPMRALVWAGIVQGFSTPPLMLLIMLMTSSRKVMGKHANSRPMNILGWITTGAIFAASIALFVSWFIPEK